MEGNFNQGQFVHAETISTLEEENKRLKSQLSHWRSAANDANHMLSAIDKGGPAHYADKFYNPALERILNKHYKEIEVYKEKLNKALKHDNGAQILYENNELKIQIGKLREQLEQKYKDYRRLELTINSINSSEAKKKCDMLSQMTEKCSKLQIENKNLKANLMLQENVKNFLKSTVDSLREEFLHLFCKCIADEGDKFLEAIKNLDKDGIPEALFKPICLDQSTNTIETETDADADGVESRILPIIAKLKIDDTERGYDSGVGSLSEEFRHMSIMLRQSSQKISDKDCEIDKLKNKTSNMEKEISRLEHEHNQTLMNTYSLENQIDKLQKDNKLMRDENQSWQVAVSFFQRTEILHHP